MSEARLAAGIEASALIRVAEAQGGFGAVLHKGDAERGALLLVIAERGRMHTLLARQFDGLRYAWTTLPVDCSDSATARLFLEKRARNDPDEWQIELDTPSAQRLVAEMTAAG
jgi:hypothetical protein